MKNFNLIKEEELKMLKGGILSETLVEGWVMPKGFRTIDDTKGSILSETLVEGFVMPDKD